jgi:predicted transporter
LGVFTIDYFLKYEGLKQAVFHQNDYGMGAAVLFGAVLIGLGITIYSAGKRSES